MTEWIWVLCGAGLLFLLGWWIYSIGVVRGVLAFGARLLWLAPIIACFFPQISSEAQNQSPGQRPIHVLVDDSKSMPSDDTASLLEGLRLACLEYACGLKVTRLSELSDEVKQGYTPLNQNLSHWMLTTGNDPWLILTDGGDSLPSVSWQRVLRTQGREKRGLIASYAAAGEVNLYVKSVLAPSFAFQDKSSSISVEIGRSHRAAVLERVQVQAVSDGHLLASVNVEFRPAEEKLSVDMALPPLAKGQHLIEVKVLPISQELRLWDNQRYVQLEVMPNTVGVLHLLGSPNWDGRFIRRFLKSEPKFDLISFFILRDKWDGQVTSERELSLIPFPVKRLFEEELPNFRVVVVQNFALFEFLEPQFQENLVQFVQNGGSMLFLGGPRALQGGDVASSALSKILPFQKDPTKISQVRPQPQVGFFDTAGSDNESPVFNAAAKFKIALAKPNETQKALATGFDDWRAMGDDLAKISNAQGIHRLDRVKFREGSYTPLLEARLEDGSKLPLAVASYPGKGRAIWIYSDTFWRLALAQSDRISRQVYHQFFGSAMNWLLRDEVRKPLIIKDLSLRLNGDNSIDWEFDLRGPAARYFRGGEPWRIMICGEQVAADDYTVQSYSSEDIHLAGSLKQLAGSQKVCSADIYARNEAFGELKVRMSEVVPLRYKDDDVGGSVVKIKELADLTDASVYHGVSERSQILNAVAQWFEADLALTPAKLRMTKNIYWLLDSVWIWFLLMFLPIEVLVRRWHLLA